MNETYTFKVAPTYTTATFARGNHYSVLPEWSGKTLAEFAAGMTGRGFSYHVEEYELSAGKFAEHIWTR